MNKFILVGVVALALIGCGDQEIQSIPEENAENITPLFITNENLKEVSLDVVFGWQSNFMRSESQNALMQVTKLQKVLKAWPEEKQTNTEPCYMQLRNETARILNLIDGIDAPKDSSEPDFKYECRQSISYKYDEARINNVWSKF